MDIIRIPGAVTGDDYSLAVHGGAGGRWRELTDAERAGYHEGLRQALEAGRTVLDGGGAALDAVCAAVTVLEDDPLFNSARGAALTAEGLAECDAAVMSGAGGPGSTGAVAGARGIRNPVLAARAVAERTRHVLIARPSPEQIAQWGLATAPDDYFVTELRREELAAMRARGAFGTHGTVGAVARDRAGHLAAATSTGGLANQMNGRIGDSPVIGAGTWAQDGAVAVSCTGDGEYFVRGAVSHEISARIRYQGLDLEKAVRATVEGELDGRGGEGGIIAVGADGATVVAFNSAAMFRGWIQDGQPVTRI